MTDPAVKLTLSGKIGYEDEISVVQAARIISFLNASVDGESTHDGELGDDLRTGGGARTGGAGGAGRRNGLTPRDALEASGARTNPEKIVALALYVERQGDKDTFTLEDIKPLFRQARESTPANLNRDLDQAVRLNWVAESDVRGEFYVKDQAVVVLEDGFDAIRGTRGAGTRPRSGGGSSRKARKSATATPAAFSEVEVSPVLDDYVNYHRLKTKTDKFLWALNAAKIWGVETVTNSEIVWLTDKLGDGISTNDVTGNYRANYKRGFANKNTEGKIRIVPDGTEYLKGLSSGADE